MFLDDLDSWLVGCLLDGMVTCTWILIELVLIEFALVLIPEINQNINIEDLKSIQNLTLDDKLGPSYGNFGSLCGRRLPRHHRRIMDLQFFVCFRIPHLRSDRK